MYHLRYGRQNFASEELTDIVVQSLIDAPEGTSGARKIMVKSLDRLVPLD